MDDYTPLRGLTKEHMDREATLFPVKPAWVYMEETPLGVRGKGFQGDAFYTAPNPPFGAVFTYHLKESIKTLKKQRATEEKEVLKEDGELAYPEWESLRAERREEKPEIILTVQDPSGQVVRRLSGPASAGFHRIAWDHRYPAYSPTSLRAPSTDNPFSSPPVGPMAVPGTYRVNLTKRVGGRITPLGEPQTFKTKSLGQATLPAQDRDELLAFQAKTGRLHRALRGAARVAGEAQERINYLKRAIIDTPASGEALDQQIRDLETRLKDLLIELNGDPVLRSHYEPSLPSISGRIQEIIFGHWGATSKPTGTHRELYRIAADQFGVFLPKLQTLIENDLAAVEQTLERLGGPWTPGRVPRWKPE